MIAKNVAPPARASVTPTWHARVWGMLTLRCPRCLTDKVFRGTFAMNDPCPDCGLIFQREEGYFLGAMYVSYTLASLLVAVIFYAVEWFLPDWRPTSLFALTVLLYLPMVPAVFRYSRVVWMFLERFGDPAALNATAYEKVRQMEFNRAAAKK